MYMICALGALGYLIFHVTGTCYGVIVGAIIAGFWDYFRDKHEIENQHAERNILVLQMEGAIQRQIEKGWSEFMRAASQERDAAVSRNHWEAEFGEVSKRVPVPW